MEKNVYDVPGMVKGGPYSTYAEAGGFIFVSGTVPIDMEKNIFITDDIKAGTELVLTNIKKVLEHAGSSLEKVVKANVYLRDMADFNDMNEVYLKFFPSDFPARTCVAVKSVPLNLPLEMECIAIK